MKINKSNIRIDKDDHDRPFVILCGKITPPAVNIMVSHPRIEKSKNRGFGLGTLGLTWAAPLEVECDPAK